MSNISLKSFKPITASFNQVNNTVIKSFTQKKHSLKSDIIVVISFIILIIVLKKLYNYLFDNIEGLSVMEKAQQHHIKSQCENNKDKICDKSSEKGKDVCMKYPCCVWAKFKDKKNKSKCMIGSATGPAIQRDDKPLDEYYYMGKKHKI
jgi:hypothetical protein